MFNSFRNQFFYDPMTNQTLNITRKQVLSLINFLSRKRKLNQNYKRNYLKKNGDHWNIGDRANSTGLPSKNNITFKTREKIKLRLN